MSSDELINRINAELAAVGTELENPGKLSGLVQLLVVAYREQSLAIRRLEAVINKLREC